MFFNFSGCLNGGGQIRPSGEETPRELLQRVQEIYSCVQTREPRGNPAVEGLYSDWLGGHNTDKAQEMLHTKYHEVEKMNTALNIKW